jgi:cathepsin L
MLGTDTISPRGHTVATCSSCHTDTHRYCLSDHLQELAHRYKVWSNNVERINKVAARNAANGVSHRLGLTAHTDLEPQAFKTKYLGAPMSATDRALQHQHNTQEPKHSLTQTLSRLYSAVWDSIPSGVGKQHRPQHWRYENVTAPASVDWRQHQPTVLGGIKDQHVNGTPCGSCWAFSAVSIMEIASAMATGEALLRLCPSSVQCPLGMPDTAHSSEMHSRVTWQLCSSTQAKG